MKMSDEEWAVFKARLAKSAFRSKFALTEDDCAYIASHGWGEIETQAHHRIEKALRPARPFHDGKQTPMRGHVVFPAQHATATCCRNCLRKWHKIPDGVELTDDQVEYVVSVLLHWLHDQAGDLSRFPVQGDLFA